MSDLWAAPTPSGPIVATVPIPGSKSLTNRWLVLAALSAGPCRIGRPLVARDTTLMAQALGVLGAAVERDGADWLVTPGPLTGPADVDCGLAGTVMRFLPPVAALARGDVRFDGDPRARVRPMSRIVTALRDLGIVIDDDGRGTLPFTVHGTGHVNGGVVEIDASESSQFVSALLLASSRFDGGLTVRHRGGSLPSQPHIDMSVTTLAEVGIRVDASSDDTGNAEWLVHPGVPQPFSVTVEPDLSNAAPFLAAAAVTGGVVTIPNWPERTDQAGDHLRWILADMGADVSLGPRGLTVAGTGQVHGIEADLHEVGELTPVVAAIATLADGPSRISGVGHLRGHETDRLAALVAEISGLGGRAAQTGDGIVIEPAPLHGGRFATYHDHRMATAAAVIGLRVPGVLVENIHTTSKTLPDFPAMWSAMVGA